MNEHPNGLTDDVIEKGIRLDEAREQGDWAFCDADSDDPETQETCLGIHTQRGRLGDYYADDVRYVVHAVNHYGAALREVQGLRKAYGLLQKGMESQAELMDGLKQETREQAAELARLRAIVADLDLIVPTHEDGTHKLCVALYGQTQARHYIGGSDARMLHDAAAEVLRLRDELAMWRPLTPEEAEKAMDSAKAEPLSEERIAEIVRKATDPAQQLPNSEQVQLAAEVQRLRETNRTLHRRVQQAESADSERAKPLHVKIRRHEETQRLAQEWFQSKGLAWMFQRSEVERQTVMMLLEERDALADQCARFMESGAEAERLHKAECDAAHALAKRLMGAMERAREMAEDDTRHFPHSCSAFQIEADLRAALASASAARIVREGKP